MKKGIIIALIAAGFFTAWHIGRQAGIHHAVTRSEIWLAEYVEPEDGNGDWVINIDLDGDIYQHTLWIF